MQINDEQWQKLQPFLVGEETHPGATGRDNRLFINTILWLVMHEARWSQLPPEFGKWPTAYMRFRRWNESGIWRQIANHANAGPELQHILNAIAAYGDAYAWRSSHRKFVGKNKFANRRDHQKQPLAPVPEYIDEHGKEQGCGSNWIWLMTHK